MGDAGKFGSSIETSSQDCTFVFHQKNVCFNGNFQYRSREAKGELAIFPLELSLSLNHSVLENAVPHAVPDRL